MEKIIVELTPEQQDQLAGAMDELHEMNERGEFGVCIAQVYGDHMRVGVLTQERAEKLHAALGGGEVRVSSVAPEVDPHYQVLRSVN